MVPVTGAVGGTVQGIDVDIVITAETMDITIAVSARTTVPLGSLVAGALLPADVAARQQIRRVTSTR